MTQYFFQEELESLTANYPDQFKIYYVLNQVSHQIQMFRRSSRVTLSWCFFWFNLVWQIWLASGDMGWWCWICIERNDSVPLPCTSIWYSGRIPFHCYLILNIPQSSLFPTLNLYVKQNQEHCKWMKHLTRSNLIDEHKIGVYVWIADPKMWTTADEQGHGCKPWSSWLLSRDAIPVLI